MNEQQHHQYVQTIDKINSRIDSIAERLESLEDLWFDDDDDIKAKIETKEHGYGCPCNKCTHHRVVCGGNI